MSYTLKNKLLLGRGNNIYNYINSYIDQHKKEKDIKRQIINKDIIHLYRFCGQDCSIVPHWCDWQEDILFSKLRGIPAGGPALSLRAISGGVADAEEFLKICEFGDFGDFGDFVLPPY